MKYLIFLLLLPLNLPAQNEHAKAIDSIMKIHSQNGFSGVLLIANNNRIDYHKAFGYREFAQKIPFQTSEIFELACVSKQFTAMIIMILQERGKLDYDEAVEKYLDIPYKNLTIRHLLTHTSGLPDYQEIMDQHWDKTKVAGNTEILEYLNKYAPPKLFEPGTKYDYSNTGYVLLASIAEKASGKDFITLCREWIFKKLKMRSTDIRSLAQKKAVSNFAIGHIYVKERNQYIRADSFPSSDYTIWLGNRKGPGRISSTAEDLLKWDKALRTEKPVKPSTLQQAFTPMKLADGSMSQYGFGWMLRPDANTGKIVLHTGDNPGYKTQIIRYITANKCILVLSNNAYANFDALVKEIGSIVETQ